MLTLFFILELLATEQNLVFDDVSDDFSKISSILDKFEEWRKNDFTTYKDTYFSICLPKVSYYKIISLACGNVSPFIDIGSHDPVETGNVESA